MASKAVNTLAALGGGGSAAAAGSAVYLTNKGNADGDAPFHKTEDQQNPSPSKQKQKKPEDKDLASQDTLSKDSHTKTTPRKRPITFRNSWANKPQTQEGIVASDKVVKYEELNVGQQFGLFILSTSENETDWNDYYTRLEAKKTPGKELDETFKAATQGYDSNSATSLNNICKSLYLKTFRAAFEREEKKTYSSDWVKIPLRYKNFWEYCSYLKEEPVNPYYSTDGYGYDNQIIAMLYQNWLLSARNEVNNLAWSIKEDWYYSLDEAKKPHKEDFDSYVAKKGDEVKEDGEFSLRKFCSLAIKERTNVVNIKTWTVLTYCSLINDTFEFLKQSASTHS